MIHRAFSILWKTNVVLPSRKVRMTILDAGSSSKFPESNSSIWQGWDWKISNALPVDDKLNNIISIKEFWEVVSASNNHKAPGMDRIPVEVYKGGLWQLTTATVTLISHQGPEYEFWILILTLWIQIFWILYNKWNDVQLQSGFSIDCRWSRCSER